MLVTTTQDPISDDSNFQQGCQFSHLSNTSVHFRNYTLVRMNVLAMFLIKPHTVLVDITIRQNKSNIRFEVDPSALKQFSLSSFLPSSVYQYPTLIYHPVDKK
jgi:hypothetical protein